MTTRCATADACLANSPLADTIAFRQTGTTRLTTDKDYDFLNRLSGVSSDPSGETMNASYTYRYNDANQRTRATLADGSYWVYQYDALGQVTSGKRYWSSGVAVAGQQYEYAFDDIGNRTGTEAGGDEDGENLRAATYTSDYHNQYDQRDVPPYIEVIGIANVTATVTVEGSSSGVYRHGEYFRKELYDLNTSTAQYPTINVDTDVTDPESGGYFLPKDEEVFIHDLDGNLTSDGRWNYEWDAENRLVVMRSLSGSPAPERWIEFEYDWQGRRIRKTVWNDRDNGQGNEVSDTIYAYDGWNLIGELEDDLTPIRTYVWGLDLSGSMQGVGGVGGLLMLNDHTDSNKHYFVAHDGNGNVVALVDESDGTYSARYEYGPFGESIRGSGDLAKDNPFHFSCKFTDNESGLVYYGFRYYNPSTGRWLSRDPMEETGGLNLYAFVGNNPIQSFDFLGLLGRCEISFSFDDDAWWEKSAYPNGTKWLKTLEEAEEHIKKKRKGCCCLKKIYLTEHNGVPGTLQLAGQPIPANIINRFKTETDEVKREVLQSSIQRQIEFLNLAKKYLCDGGEIVFVQCGSFGGPQGSELKEWLRDLFGPNIDVTAFAERVKWFYWHPKETDFEEAN